MNERLKCMRKNKLTPLERLRKVSEDAVSIIRVTISALQKANEDIEAECVSNQEQVSKILETNKALEQLKADNQKVMKNFEALLK